MKKLIAVLIAGTFILGTAVAQTTTTPTVKKETVASTQKIVEKKNAAGTRNVSGKKKVHKSKGHVAKKAAVLAPKTK